MLHSAGKPHSGCSFAPPLGPPRTASEPYDRLRLHRDENDKRTTRGDKRESAQYPFVVATPERKPIKLHVDSRNVWRTRVDEASGYVGPRRVATAAAAPRRLPGETFSAAVERTVKARKSDDKRNP